MSEYIVVIVLYYFDLENIIMSFFEFCMKVDEYLDLEDIIGQDNYWFNQVMFGCLFKDGEVLQKFGNVEMCQGCFFVFLNVL